MCLLARTTDTKKVHDGMSLIIVPMDSKGIVKAKKIEKMGMNSSDTGLIFFEDVRVPCSNIIGEEGMGFTYQMLQFQVKYFNFDSSKRFMTFQILGRKIGSCSRCINTVAKGH